MIIVCRHGQTFWNLENRKQGQKDSPLTLKGVKQAMSLTFHLNKYLEEVGKKDALKIVYTSELNRAVQTAALVNQGLNNDYRDLIKNPVLNEHCFGCWEGFTELEIEECFPGALAERYATVNSHWTYKIPGKGGESYALLYQRVTPFFTSIAGLPQQNVYVIVAHDMVSRVIRGFYTGMPRSEIIKAEHKQNEFYVLEKLEAKRVILQ